MKKPTVDYSRLRLSTLTTPEYSHVLLLLGWVGYFLMYFLTENLIPVENCHVIHTRLDDLIPFCECFVLPYVLWYLLVAGSLAYFFFYDVESFRRESVFIIVTQVVAMLFYIFYPSVQDLRPEVFPRENVFTAVIGFLYRLDTPTGVFPSLHVAYSLGILSTWLKRKQTPVWFKLGLTVFVLLICVATVFIKQHSVADIFMAIPVCLLAELLAFGGWWRVHLFPQWAKGGKPA